MARPSGGGIRVPGILDELVELFLRDAPVQLKELRKAVGEGDERSVEPYRAQGAS